MAFAAQAKPQDHSQVLRKEYMMPKAKENSVILDKATARLQGIKAINPTIDLGNGLTALLLEGAINDTQTKMNEYNQQLSVVEQRQAALKEAEQKLTDLFTRFLAGVAAKYGKDSVEYAQAGGTRKRDRKRPIPRPKLP
jgi:hypothetical protein